MKKKLNVLLIAHNFWPENFPINSIVKNLSNKINFTIITGKPNYPLGEFYKGYQTTGVKIQTYNKTNKVIRVPILPRKKGTSIQLFLNYVSFLFSGIFFGYFYTRGKKYDYVLVYCPSPATQICIGLFFKKIKKIKLITWVQDVWPDSFLVTGHFNKTYLYSFFNYVFHYLYKKNDLLLLQSPIFKKYFTKNKISNKSIVVPNAADESLAKFGISKKKFFDKNFFNISYTGNIGTGQPFEKFCLAANKVYIKNKNITFNIFGEGKAKQSLIDDIKKYNNKNIKIFNYVNRSKLAGIYKESDALLLLLKDKKIFNMTIPSKFQNYLIFKKPILGWITGQTAKIIKQNKCGLTAYPGNIKEFEIMVLKIYSLYRSKQYHKFCHNSYQLYKNSYTNKKICNLIIESIIRC
jgi:glycosyltransferase involved in cell wall biosynthesis